METKTGLQVQYPCFVLSLALKGVNQIHTYVDSITRRGTFLVLIIFQRFLVCSCPRPPQLQLSGLTANQILSSHIPSLPWTKRVARTHDSHDKIRLAEQKSKLKDEKSPDTEDPLVAGGEERESRPSNSTVKVVWEIAERDCRAARYRDVLCDDLEAEDMLGKVKVGVSGGVSGGGNPSVAFRDGARRGVGGTQGMGQVRTTVASDSRNGVSIRSSSFSVLSINSIQRIVSRKQQEAVQRGQNIFLSRREVAVTSLVLRRVVLLCFASIGLGRTVTYFCAGNVVKNVRGGNEGWGGLLKRSPSCTTVPERIGRQVL